jgi:DMSO/TMAO reductase YedYZ heme-binding membrane subunit
VPGNKQLDRWTLVGVGLFLVAVISAASVAVDGTGPDGIRSGIRNTARLSAVLFSFTFMASSVAELWRGATGKWMLRNRKYLGLSFACSHFAHAGFLAALGVAHPDVFRAAASTTGMIGGGIGYGFLAAMTITSFDGPRKALGKTRWKILHTSGMYLFWIIFSLSYVLGAPAKSPAYLPLSALLVGAMGMRVAARLRKRARRLARAA